MDEIENIQSLSFENENKIIAETTRIVVEDFLLLWKDIPEGFMSVPPPPHITPTTVCKKNTGEAIGAVRYAFHTLREDDIPGKISSILQMVREMVTPDNADRPLAPTTYERIFAQVVTRLRLAPVHDRRSDWKISDVFRWFHHDFEEHPSGPFSEYIPLNRIRSNADNTFADLVDRESRACMTRRETLVDYFHASDDRVDIMGQVKIDMKLIADIRQEMVKFCDEHKRSNPFILDAWDDQNDFYPDDSPVISSAKSIFQLSSVEKFLRQFLPQWTMQRESFLFDFHWSAGDFENGDIEVIMREIYDTLEERKLLVYYFADTADKSDRSPVNQREIKYKLDTILAQEIRSCREKSNYEQQLWESLEPSYDVSFIHKHLPRIEILLTYTNKNSFWHLSQPLKELLQKCRRFITQVDILKGDSVREEEKKRVLENYHRMLYGSISHIELTLSMNDPVSNEIREICEAIKGHLLHKEIDS